MKHENMIIRKSLAGLAVFVAVFAATGADFYVDAVNGNDSWDGTRTYENRDESTNPVKGPRKTLQGIVAVANNSVAVIHAAPGYYDEGSYEATGTMSNYYARVYLNNGQTLIATKGPEKTFIVGIVSTASGASYGNGPGALRCVTLNNGAKVIGFTICGGRVRQKTESNTCLLSSYGGGVIIQESSTGYIVDCIISNNAAVRGGAVYNQGTKAWDSSALLNCRVINNRGTSPGAGTMYCTQINSIFKDNNGYYPINYGRALNCTILDGVSGSTVSNSYIATGADKGNSNKFGGCFYVTGNENAGSTYIGCTAKAAAAYVFAADGVTPLADSPLVDAVADTSFYDAKWPSALSSYKSKDALGGARVVGVAMDVGAVEYFWLTHPPKGVSVVTNALQNGSVEVTFTRTFTSKDEVLKSLTFAGETVDFSDKADDFVFTKTVTSDLAALSLSVVYDKDVWYVDDDGDDNNDGFRKGSPFKTIKKAMGLASSGGVIHVAPGLYNEGNMGKKSSESTTNRVEVKAGVTLVGDQGAASTIIEGAYATVNPSSGCGNDAIRCVRLNAGSVIRGFTLRNGATYNFGDGASDWGGGVRGDSTSGNPSYAVDCVVENCRAVRGGGTYGGCYVRCVIRNNASANPTYSDLGAYDAVGYYGCVFSEGKSNYGVYCSGASKLVNCSLIGTSLLANGSLQVYNSYIDTEKGGSKFYRCAIDSQVSGTKASYYEDGTEKSLASSGKTGVDTTTFRPLFVATALRDKGNDDYLDLYPEAWRGGPDISGGARIENGAVDIGAGEYTFDGQANVGFTVETIDQGGGLSALRVTPVHNSDLLCTGFSFNGIEYVFDGLTPIVTEAVEGDPMALFVVRYAERPTDWYVSPTGNDDNFGYASDVPFRTFDKAMSMAQSNDVVHALAGTYDYGFMGLDGGTTNRVEVKEWVGLVADNGPEMTVIVGRKSESDNGYGPGAIRCVYLKNGSYVQGFTLCGGGAVKENDVNKCGGGVSGSSAADKTAVVDCVISNNAAVRGGGAYYTTCIRCRFSGNKASSWANGSGGYFGNYIDCVFNGNNVCTPGLVLNCSVYSNGTALTGLVRTPSSLSAGAQTINTVLFEDSEGSKRYFSNCVFRATKASPPATMDSSCKFGKAEADRHNFDKDYRPLSPDDSIIVDKGWLDAYDAHFPALWARFKTNYDAAGGQRVYNGKIDIGAGEYDWRPAYGRRLNGRRFADVAGATPGVEMGEQGVTLGDGDSLSIDWTAQRSGKQTFSVAVAGGGAVTVLAGGEPIAASDGVYSFEAEAGSVTRIVISFSGEGAAEVSSFRSASVGVLLIVR